MYLKGISGNFADRLGGDQSLDGWIANIYKQQLWGRLVGIYF